jgi:serine/threonine protein phosphatase PrpC
MFIIVASDGIWEFVSSQEAVEITEKLWSAGRESDCCRALIALATERWTREEGCVDDITLQIVSLGNSRL